MSKYKNLPSQARKQRNRKHREETDVDVSPDTIGDLFSGQDQGGCSLARLPDSAQDILEDESPLRYELSPRPHKKKRGKKAAQKSNRTPKPTAPLNMTQLTPHHERKKQKKPSPLDQAKEIQANNGNRRPATNHPYKRPSRHSRDNSDNLSKQLMGLTTRTDLEKKRKRLNNRQAAQNRQGNQEASVVDLVSYETDQKDGGPQQPYKRNRNQKSAQPALANLLACPRNDKSNSNPMQRSAGYMGHVQAKSGKSNQKENEKRRRQIGDRPIVVEHSQESGPKKPNPQDQQPDPAPKKRAAKATQESRQESSCFAGDLRARKPGTLPPRNNKGADSIDFLYDELTDEEAHKPERSKHKGKKRKSSTHKYLSSESDDSAGAGDKQRTSSSTNENGLAFGLFDDDIEDSDNDQTKRQPRQALETTTPNQDIASPSVPRKDRRKIAGMSVVPTKSTRSPSAKTPQKTGVLGLTKQNGGKKSSTGSGSKAKKIDPGESLYNNRKQYGSRGRRPIHDDYKLYNSRDRGSTVAGVEPGSSGRPTRSRSKKAKKKGAGAGTVIEIEDSDDDEEPAATSDTPKELRQKVPRFAFGTKIFKEGCELVFQDGVLQLLLGTRSARSTSNELKAKISKEDLLGHKFYVQSDTERQPPSHLSFLALKVRTTTRNELKTYRTDYQPDQTDNPSKTYVVIEFQHRSHLTELLHAMEHVLEPSSDGAELPLELAGEYRMALMVEDEKEAKKEVKKKPRKRRRRGEPKYTDAFVNNREQDEVLLVYPFAGDPDEMEKCAEGLNEANGKFPAPEGGGTIDISTDENLTEGMENLELEPTSSSEEETRLATATVSSTEAPAKTDRRRHFLTIRVRDFERLCPGEFLNDSLVDFWLQWITRNIDPTDGENPIHVFSSHFFTTLDEESPEAVKKWTAKRGIDVFKKKFVFIPINGTLHWSLCVVVNPGHIKDMKEEPTVEDEDGPMACLLFLDSLKAHRKKKISNKIRGWLNAEWKRIKSDEEDQDVFESTKKFPLLDPRIPYQDNSWDCGVFVCRYAFAVLALRDREFNRNDRWFEKDLFGNCDLFQFDMDDIERLRKEIMTLIERLSVMYLPWKDEHDNKLKLERQAKKRKAQQMKEADDPGVAATKPESLDDGDAGNGEESDGKPGVEAPKPGSDDEQQRPAAVEQHDNDMDLEAQKLAVVEQDNVGNDSIGTEDPAPGDDLFPGDVANTAGDSSRDHAASEEFEEEKKDGDNFEQMSGGSVVEIPDDACHPGKALLAKSRSGAPASPSAAGFDDNGTDEDDSVAAGCGSGKENVEAYQHDPLFVPQNIPRYSDADPYGRSPCKSDCGAVDFV